MVHFMRPDQATNPGDPPRVVLVDDEPHITHMISRKLAQSGYEIRTAGDGRQALDLINNETPDLIVTDLQMPYMSGIELADRLFKSERTRSIPVIMLTARGFMVEQEVSELGNIKALLSKPFSPRSLVELVNKVIEQSDDRAQGHAA